LTSAKRLDRIIWLMLVCSGIVAAQSIANYFRGIHLVEGDRLGGPGSGIFGNPNDLAMNMVTFLPMAIVVAVSHRYSLPRRLTAAGIVAALLATIVFTKSRGGILGLGAMLIALVFLGRKVRKGFGTTVVVAVLVGSPFMPSSFWDRMTSIVDEKK